MWDKYSLGGNGVAVVYLLKHFELLIRCPKKQNDVPPTSSDFVKALVLIFSRILNTGHYPAPYNLTIPWISALD